MRRSEGEHRSIRLAGWAAYRAWRATGVDLVVVGVLVGWLAGLPERRGPTGILGGALGLALVLTGVTILSSGRRRSRMLNEADGAGSSPTLPVTRLPLLVSSIVTGAGLLLAVLGLLMAIRP